MVKKIGNLDQNLDNISSCFSFSPNFFPLMMINFCGTYLFVQTQLYTEDWIGLKTLDEAGKVKFISVTGSHLEISRSDMKKYIVPYLKDQSLMAVQLMTRKSSSHKWVSSMLNFLMNMGRFSADQPLLSVVY